MSTLLTPGPWHVAPAIGYPGRLRVQRKNKGAIEIRNSASGKPSIYRTRAAALRVARMLNEDEATDAELKAKYAGLPPLPSLSLGRTIAKAIGSKT